MSPFVSFEFLNGDTCFTLQIYFPLRKLSQMDSRLSSSVNDMRAHADHIKVSARDRMNRQDREIKTVEEMAEVLERKVSREEKGFLYLWIYLFFCFFLSGKVLLGREFLL